MASLRLMWRVSERAGLQGGSDGYYQVKRMNTVATVEALVTKRHHGRVTRWGIAPRRHSNMLSPSTGHPPPPTTAAHVCGADGGTDRRADGGADGGRDRRAGGRTHCDDLANGVVTQFYFRFSGIFPKINK